MLKPFLLAVGLSTMTAASLLAGTPVAAADDSMMKIDCTKAGSMMSDASKMGGAAMMSGDTDKDFMVIMMDHEKGTIMMMQVEAQCGKDPKMKAMAQKGLTDENTRMALFRNMNTSQ